MTAVVAQPRPLALPVLRTLRWLGRTYGVLAAWFTGVILVLWVGAILVALQFGDLGQSMAQFARQGTTWFPFSIAITVLAAYHVVHIAAGMTRRSLGAAMLLISVANAVVLSAVVAALFAAERVLYAANGWDHRIVDQGWFPAEAGDVLAILGWQTLLVTAAQVSGLLVVVTYLRGGPWRGTLALPLTAGPVPGIWWLLSRGVTGDWLTVGTRVGLTILVTAAMAAAFLVLLQRLQVRPARA